MDSLKIDEELARKFEALVKELEQEDYYTRENFLRLCRKCELFWNDIQYTFWSDSDNDWKFPNINQLEDAVYTRVINIFKAHGESIIAALSIELPSVVFFPEDADKVEDITASRAFKTLGELIQTNNKAELLFVRALYVLFTQGLVAAYNYSELSEKYGTYQIENYKSEDVTNTSTICPNCGGDVQEPDESTGMSECQLCGPVIPEVSTSTETVKLLDSVETVPKARERIDVFGPVNVKVPFYARNQDEVGYLELLTESPASAVKAMYDVDVSPTGDLVSFSRWARTPVDYTEVITTNLVTIRRLWLRPWEYNRLNDEDAKMLREAAPDGVRLIFANDTFVEAKQDKLDDHWTLTLNPLALNIHSRPLGASLLPIQEMENDQLNLRLQTIEYGIPQTFADSDVLDFNKYSQSETKPGMVYPVKGRAGIGIDNSFHETKTASMSQEAKEFDTQLEQKAQFVVGSFPSIYGGPSASGSKTLGEYAMSRTQALQRLSISWKMMSFWWSDVIDRATHNYVKAMHEDERIVKRENNAFYNAWIRQSELSGNVGRVTPEFSEKFPLSWAQKRDTLVELLNMQLPEINSVVFSPDNAEMIVNTFGFTGLKIPYADDRLVQRKEIATLLQGPPTQGEQGMMQSTIPVDPELDNHPIHIEVLKGWLNSLVGQDARETNPEGYSNCRAHLSEHLMFMQQQQMQQQQMQAMQQGGNNGAGSTEGSPDQAA